MTLAIEGRCKEFILVPPARGNFVLWGRDLGELLYKRGFDYVLQKHLIEGYVLLALNSPENSYSVRINEFGNRATLTCEDVRRPGYRDLEISRIETGLEAVFRKVEESQTASPKTS